MNEVFLRPRVDELTFHLYARPLHPELFETLASRRVERDDYALVVRITPTGHVLTWQAGDIHLAEITAARDQLLPRRGHLLRHRFQGGRSGSIKPLRGIS